MAGQLVRNGPRHAARAASGWARLGPDGPTPLNPPPPPPYNPGWAPRRTRGGGATPPAPRPCGVDGARRPPPPRRLGGVRPPTKVVLEHLERGLGPHRVPRVLAPPLLELRLPVPREDALDKVVPAHHGKHGLVVVGLLEEVHRPLHLRVPRARRRAAHGAAARLEEHNRLGRPQRRLPHVHVLHHPLPREEELGDGVGAVDRLGFGERKVAVDADKVEGVPPVDGLVRVPVRRVRDEAAVALARADNDLAPKLGGGLEGLELRADAKGVHLFARGHGRVLPDKLFVRVEVGVVGLDDAPELVVVEANMGLEQHPHALPVDNVDRVLDGHGVRAVPPVVEEDLGAVLVLLKLVKDERDGVDVEPPHAANGRRQLGGEEVEPGERRQRHPPVRAKPPLAVPRAVGHKGVGHAVARAVAATLRLGAPLPGAAAMGGLPRGLGRVGRQRRHVGEEAGDDARGARGGGCDRRQGRRRRRNGGRRRPQERPPPGGGCQGHGGPAEGVWRLNGRVGGRGAPAIRPSRQGVAGGEPGGEEAGIDAQMREGARHRRRGGCAPPPRRARSACGRARVGVCHRSLLRPLLLRGRRQGPVRPWPAA
ncbi:hypothetical protein BU14_0196s0002 [Porphyra umbilicalis]|uniref:Uncharacterized protein n=1 Tax=Porphyra umbilicalis TaxID=2786 RepID=A0A1X6P6G2_PORUM|nr:hypothetical protein BU14_0196s0002 [Porphyra umbilicalis]|eukprot:OSX76335.1 hypothetical protein BU14_0196s0002 [Porphyra umbilicalis]